MNRTLPVLGLTLVSLGLLSGCRQGAVNTQNTGEVATRGTASPVVDHSPIGYEAKGRGKWEAKRDSGERQVTRTYPPGATDVYDLTHPPSK